MLSRLAIRDFAVVASAELEFGRGMTVISGETGAGKSLLVDALGFLSGLRADSGMVRHGADRAELSAEFALDDAPGALAWLREAELDDAHDEEQDREEDEGELDHRLAARVALPGAARGRARSADPRQHAERHRYREGMGRCRAVL